jgi:hypothetical protein
VAVETSTGEKPTVYALALGNAERLRGLAHLAQLAHEHEGAFGDNGDGIVRLLQDASAAAAELLDRIRTDGGRNG